MILRDFQLITMKPLMYVANVSEAQQVNQQADQVHVDKLREIAQQTDSRLITICAQLEAEMISMDEADKKEFLSDLGWQESGLNRVIREGFDLLGLSTYFTAGPKELRSWVINKHCTAPQAAAKIHTDFERGFIRAEVIGYEDYIQAGGESKAKEQGKLRVEGKTYRVEDGDVIHFLFNV